MTELKISPDETVRALFEETARLFESSLEVARHETWPLDQVRALVERTEYIRIDAVKKIVNLIKNHHPVLGCNSLTFEIKPSPKWMKLLKNKSVGARKKTEASALKILPDIQSPDGDYLNFWKWFIRWAQGKFPKVPRLINDAQSIEFSEDNANDAMAALSMQAEGWVKACRAIAEAFASPDGKNTEHKKKTKLKPLPERAQAVFDLLNNLPEGEAMTGPKILSQLFKKKNLNMDQSTLTRNIIPLLKKTRHVRNVRGAGYFIEK